MGHGLVRLHYNLTSICCGYKEKIVKNDPYRRIQCLFKFRKLQYLTLNQEDDGLITFYCNVFEHTAKPAIGIPCGGSFYLSLYYLCDA